MSRSMGATTVTILADIQERSGYGLDIINRTGLLPGTVYTTLRRLERRKLVQGRWEEAEIAQAERRPRRRYYSLTEAGKLALEEARARLGAMGFELKGPLPATGESE